MPPWSPGPSPTSRAGRDRSCVLLHATHRDSPGEAECSSLPYLTWAPPSHPPPYVPEGSWGTGDGREESKAQVTVAQRDLCAGALRPRREGRG